MLKEYYNETGKNLLEDDLINYKLLSELNIKYNCNISLEKVYEILNKSQKILPSTSHLDFQK